MSVKLSDLSEDEDRNAEDCGTNAVLHENNEPKDIVEHCNNPKSINNITDIIPFKVILFILVAGMSNRR